MNNNLLKVAADIIRKNSKLLTRSTIDRFFVAVTDDISEIGSDYYEEDLLEIRGTISKLLEDAGINWIALVECIPEGAFGAHYEDVKSIMMPSNVISLAGWAFYGSDFTEITFAGQLEYIGMGALDARLLRKIKFLKSIKQCEFRAEPFGDTANSLSEIDVLDSKEDIKKMSFIDYLYSPKVTIKCTDGDLIYINGELQGE